MTDHSELVKRLRHDSLVSLTDCAEAADAIEALQQEEAALRHDIERHMDIAREAVQRAEKAEAVIKEVREMADIAMSALRAAEGSETG